MQFTSLYCLSPSFLSICTYNLIYQVSHDNPKPCACMSPSSTSTTSPVCRVQYVCEFSMYPVLLYFCCSLFPLSFLLSLFFPSPAHPSDLLPPSLIQSYRFWVCRSYLADLIGRPLKLLTRYAPSHIAPSPPPLFLLLPLRPSHPHLC